MRDFTLRMIQASSSSVTHVIGASGLNHFWMNTNNQLTTSQLVLSNVPTVSSPQLLKNLCKHTLSLFMKSVPWSTSMSPSNQSQQALWQSLRILSFNIEGLKGNKSYFSSIIDQYQPKIIFFQEIWLPYHEATLLKLYLPSYNFKISTPDMFSSNEDKILKPGQVWHGVAVGWQDDVHADFEYIPSNNTRFVGIRIALKTGRILSISLYAPTSGKDDDFLECITDLTEYILSNISAGDRVLIGTDSNCSTKSTPRRQLCWGAFCDTFSLLSHSTGSSTFHHHNGSSESSIDLFLSSKDLKLYNPL